MNARWLSASELYRWSLRRCSRAGAAVDDDDEDAALLLPTTLAAEQLEEEEESVLKKGSLSGSTARHDAPCALVEVW